jgi:hypothetical protein
MDFVKSQGIHPIVLLPVKRWCKEEEIVFLINVIVQKKQRLENVKMMIMKLAMLSVKICLQV